MQLLNFFAQDVNGNIVPGAACTIFLAGTSTLATGLLDAGGNPLSNPFTASAIGQVQFSAPQGFYDVQMASGLLSYKIQVQSIDATAVAANAIAAAESSSAASESSTSAALSAAAAAASAASTAGQISTRQPIKVSKAADLRTLSSAAVGSVDSLGFYAAGDGGAASYLYDPTDTTSADNGSTVFVAGDGARRKLIMNDFNVRKFGAKGDGVNDDTVFIQNAITAAMLKAGMPYLPGGTYRTTAPLVIDYTGAFYATSSYARKIHITGDGAVTTEIKPDPGAYAAFSFLGNSTNNTAYLALKGIRLTGPNRLAGSVGMSIVRAAFVELDDAIVENFAAGLNGVDLEQVGFYNAIFRFNEKAIIGVTGTMTSPNSWSFYNCAVSNNTKSGVTIQNANALNWNGGSLQYNGYIGGGSDNYGISLPDAGNGYGTIGFTNMIFEGNGGLGDFVSVQTSGQCSVSFDNVCFIRTASFFSATVIGAANNGSGAIRLTLNSTAAINGLPKVFVWGVGGTTEANNPVPWSFTVIDSTHIDLTGSTFTNAYTSGGKVTVVGFGDNNIIADGTAPNCTYAITNSTFKTEISYSPSATRPSIALPNSNSKIYDDGSNYFQSSIEKLVYAQTQTIGDDGSVWAQYTPTVTAAGGTFTATAVGKVKKVGKIIHFQAVVTTTSYSATPTAPLTITLPFVCASSASVAAFNTTSVLSATGFIAAGVSNVRIWSNGVFPIIANGQTLVVSGEYETI